MSKHFLSICMMVLAFTACGGNTGGDISDIVGPYTATGTIVGTGSSLVRRGTHVLNMNGRSRFYLESRTVDLNQFINMYAVIQGEVSPNSHSKFFPIFQVSSVVPLEQETSVLDLQQYRIASLGITLDAPQAWKSDVQNGRLTFMIPTEKGPFIAIENDDVEFFPEEGLHVRVDGHNGIRSIDEASGVHRVFIKRSNDSVILFTFGPKGEDSLVLRDAFYTLLQSVRFDAIKDVEDPDGGEWSGSKQPCGGSAGVLCPEGEYCEVQEFDTGIGKCRAL